MRSKPIGWFVLFAMLLWLSSCRFAHAEPSISPTRGLVKLEDFATANDGEDDTAGLRAAMRAGLVVDLGVGNDWDFEGPLVDGAGPEVGTCRIMGRVSEFAAQHLEEDPRANRFASRLNVRGLKQGQPWIRWRPGDRGDGKPDRGGQFGISNTVLQINGDGCALEIGDPKRQDGHGCDVRGLTLSGLYVTAPDQLAHGHFDGERLPAFAHDALITVASGYDVNIHDVAIRGGGTQLRLVGCDRPKVHNIHGMWPVRCLAIDSLPGHATVDASVLNVFVEGAIGNALDFESAQVSQVQVEVGYGAKIGRLRLACDWRIEAGGDRVQAEGLAGRLFAGQIVYVDGVPLRVTSVDARGFAFDESQSHCYFAKSAKGEAIEACYGVGIVARGGRASLNQWASDQNANLPGLPIAAFVLTSSTLPVRMYAANRGGWIGDDNLPAIVGHCVGAQHAVEASVDFRGWLMRPDHPLCHAAVGPLPDPNWNRWLGIWAGNDEGRQLRFRRLDDRWTVRLDDSKSGRRMPPPKDRKYSFQVKAHEPCTLTIYGGKGRPNEHKLAAGEWQTVSGMFGYEPSVLLLNPAPVSVAIGGEGR